MKDTTALELARLLTLHHARGLGDRTLSRLFSELRDTAEILERIRSGEIRSARGGERIELPSDKFISEKLRVVEKLKIRVIPSFSQDFPESLLHLYDPPPILYVRGEMSFDWRMSLAVVGTRAYSEYGKRALHALLPDVVKSGIAIISGLAMGIDRIAHEEALSRNGMTVAVLGSGVDVVAPRQNFGLYEKIVDTGCVMSEFPLGTEPTRYTFPQRNRIVAALAKAVLIVEAPEKSGALITAEYAADIGREILSVPGSILSATSVGTNGLIAHGARPIIQADDILDVFGLAGVGPQLSEMRELEGFTGIEEAIVKCVGGGEMTIDDLAEVLADYSFEEVVRAVSSLELRDVLTRTAGDTVMLAVKRNA